MINKDAPFLKLYNCLSPEDFIFLFKEEAPQTIAFILSFCPRKNFSKKVIRLLRKKEENDSNLKITCVIREYLSRCCNSSYDNDLINIIEEQILTMTDGYKNYSGSRKFRKGFFGEYC